MVVDVVVIIVNSIMECVFCFCEPVEVVVVAVDALMVVVVVVVVLRR